MTHVNFFFIFVKEEHSFISHKNIIQIYIQVVNTKKV